MHKYYIKKYQDPSGGIAKLGANETLKKIKGFTDQHSDFIKGGVQKLVGLGIDASTDIENNLLGVQRDGVDDLANGAAKIATKFGPWGYLAAGVIKGANFLSKGFGEKVGGFDGGTGSSGFQDYTMEGKQFRANPLNIFSAFTKSNSAKAYEAHVKRQAEEFAKAKNIVDEQDMQNKARNQRLQEENMLTQQTLTGGADYSAILAKKGGKLDILKAQLGYKFIKKEPIIEEIYEEQPERDIETIELFEDDSIEYQNEQLQNESEKKKNIEQFKNGGSIIPEGALHKNKHHIDNPELEGQITEKGIPVITIEEDGGVIQHAEIEAGEIILEISISKQIEKLWKEGTDEAAIEAGKILAKEICRNTTDKTGLIKQTKKDENNNQQ